MGNRVISHKHCFDGAAAAYLAWRYMSRMNLSANYHYCNYQTDIPPGIENGDQLHILDFSFKRDHIFKLMEKDLEIRTLDHHESAAVEAILMLNQLALEDHNLKLCLGKLTDGIAFGYRNLAVYNEALTAIYDFETPDQVEDWIDREGVTSITVELPTRQHLHHFNLNNSGAKITHDYLFPYIKEPPLISYIQDRDLWRWALPDSEAVSEGLSQVWLKDWRQQTMQGNAPESQAEIIAEFEFLDGLAKDQDYVRKMVEIGKPRVDERNAKVDEICQNFKFVEIMGMQIPIVRADKYYSWVGHKLCVMTDAPFGAVWRELEEGYIQIDLRTTRDRKIRVNRIAREFGGGGHPTAAGFKYDPSLNWI